MRLSYGVDAVIIEGNTMMIVVSYMAICTASYQGVRGRS